MKSFKKKALLIPHPDIKKTCILPELKILHHQMQPKMKTEANGLSLININRKHYNKDSISWFSHKYNKTQIINSINDLIVTPRPFTPSSDSKTKIKANTKTKTNQNQAVCKKAIRSQSSQKDKLLINIKYLFTNDKLKKILKLKDLFLDFDFDKNKIMELEEIQAMFAVNNIKVNKSDLIGLFFKEYCKMNNKKNQKKLYLNFYQFIQFCLSQDDEFRNFMKKLKEENKKDNEYLPINFNALLDYFIDRGEERKCLKKINKAIESMDKAIDTDDVLIKDVKKIEKLNNDIDFDAIIKEFECLFVLTKNRGEVTQGKKRIRSPSKEKTRKTLKPLQECHSFESYDDVISERKKDNEKLGNVIHIPKRSSLQFRFLGNQDKRCFSSKNVFLY